MGNEKTRNKKSWNHTGNWESATHFGLNGSQIPAFLIPGFTDFSFSHSGFYRFRPFAFQIFQISSFLIPGFTDSSFLHYRFYRFDLAFSFRVLQILAFSIPGSIQIPALVHSRVYRFCLFPFRAGFYRFRLFPFQVLQILAFSIPGFIDSGFSHSRFYLFRLFPFRFLQNPGRLFSFQVLLIPAFRIPGFLVPHFIPHSSADSPFLVLQIAIQGE